MDVASSPNLAQGGPNGASKKVISEERRAVLHANLEKARIARREQAAMTKQTRDAEKEVLKRRQEARLAELNKEKDALERRIIKPAAPEGEAEDEEVEAPRPTPAVVKSTKKKAVGSAPAAAPAPPRSRTRAKPAIVEESDSSSSCSSEEDEEQVAPAPVATPTRSTRTGRRVHSVPSAPATADALRQRAYEAAFASLFPTWQIAS